MSEKTRTLRVKIRTLTPLWTGGVDGTMDRIHETGIIGSLRWWYEAIVRGLGGSACDPSEHKCSFDAEKYRKSKAIDERQRLRDAGLCDVCQVFGATGWKRRFRMEVVEYKTQPVWEPGDKVLNIRPPERTRGWYLLPGYVGELALNFQGDEKVISMLACLFLWLEKYGSIGARPQLGYGAFRVLNRDDVIKQARKWQWEIIGNEAIDMKYPDLRSFLFFRYEFTPSVPGWWTQVPGVGRVGSKVQPVVTHWRTVPTTPALKNEWRFHQWRGNWHEQIEIFGTLRPGRQRGRIGATWAYRENGVWQVHGWAWMPPRENLAMRLWQILTDRSVWSKVLSVQGNLTVFPSGQWKKQTSKEVQKLLQGVCHD